jgi:hypothetical protein
MGKKIKDITRKIEDFEYYQNGFAHLSGAWAKAKNVRLSGGIALADVTLCSGQGEPEEKFFDCEYPLEKLEAVGV